MQSIMDRTTPPGERPGASGFAGVGSEELARLAYRLLDTIDFLEMNDGNRLGYHLYLYLKGDIPSIAEAIYEAKARTPVGPKELEMIIAERLRAAGAGAA